MASFPETSFTLLEKLGRLAPGQDEAAWQRLWELYMPALRQFIVWKGGERNADDIVQQVLVKLVDVLRTGQYKVEKGRFHSYLAMMAYNEVHMQHRKDQVRHVDEHVPIDNFVNDGTHDDQQLKFETPDELKAQDAPAGESLDADWQRAVVEAARDHVLTKTALSDRDRSVYRQFRQEERPIEDVAKEFNISRNLVSKICSRIDQRIVTIGREMARLNAEF